jgi:transposase
MGISGVYVFMRKARGIVLDAETRKELERLSGSRSESVRLAQRSRIVLLAATGWDNETIGAELGITRQKAGRWRSRFAELGLEGILRERRRSGRPPIISNRKRAAIVRKTLDEKPANATQWSRASMAADADVSPSTVGRIWRVHGLKPHLVKTFKLSHDKRFGEKLEDVVGLYLHPPENAIVLSCDEKSQMQALDRTQPGLPMKKGRCGTMTHDYKRNGTTTLFAALNTLTGSVIQTCLPKHRHQEWIRFLNLIKRHVPTDKAIHIICDNYATHKHPKVIAWLARNTRVHVHFTPTSASWLNMVERFFRDLSQRRLRRGVFRSVDELVQAVTDYVASHNDNPKPFIWTATASDILEKVTRARKKLDKLQYL